MVWKERWNLKDAAFELVDEMKTGGAKIVFKEKGRRLTKGVNRRYRSGAVVGEEESERWKVKVDRRGSVRVERPVRRERSADARRAGTVRPDGIGARGPGSWHERIGDAGLRRAGGWSGRNVGRGVQFSTARKMEDA